MIHHLKKAYQKISNLLEQLEPISNLAVLIAAITYLTYGEQKQRNTEVTQAWTVITAAYEQRGSGGRIQALELLNASPSISGRRRFPWFWLTWNPESLQGLEAPNAFLQDIELPNADLWQANLKNANLRGANLRNSRLEGANLQSSTLAGADLQNSSLRIANLAEADLFRANLRSANLRGANLQNAGLVEANLQSSNLAGAKLQKATLNGANLKDAKYTSENASPELCKSLSVSYPCPTVFLEGFKPESRGMVRIN
ncbi:pentapeptide repeat-containing protein [Calothrix sp. PCC 6303]|uniref:pentapeptide repeat-containing protein n=1 Tax=Calothrix sp. PCC 6303 TaxID=1170562 RepID=UPI0002A024A9|nr:pentapeptide repeat-containing protein [Calothrix sp. PCC 6303]AFZ01703.1 pentapeptide repeat protein [Calothrix sp. PCC 6303]